MPTVADLDRNGKPEIIVQSTVPNAITALRSDCSVLFDKPHNLMGGNHFAVGDLDGDAAPEIVGVDFRARLVLVFSASGDLLAKAPAAFRFTGTLAADADHTGPSLADLNGQSPPEILMAGQVLRYVPGKTNLEEVWNQTPVVAGAGSASIAADLDGDQQADVIVGRQIYDGRTGAEKTPLPLKSLPGGGAFAAVADFNGDKRPDLVLSNEVNGTEQVSVYDFSSSRYLLGPLERNGQQGAGPPTVADYDGDGLPEFAVASRSNLEVFDLECVRPPLPSKCKGGGLLWIRPTQDRSSWSTGSAAFDFDGDGAAEAIYRDECWLRVYRGHDGRTLAAFPLTSLTGTEYPAVVDLDADGHAEIIATSDTLGKDFDLCRNQGPDPDTGTPWTGYTRGVFVFHDPLHRWMGARGVWNQHSYHVTNVNDDLSVPAVEKPSWTAHNTYRAQPALTKAGPLPDFTAGDVPSVEPGSPDCASLWLLHVNLCNRGAAASSAGVPGTFYRGDPRSGARAICTTRTKGALAPGTCEVVSCGWPSPPAGTVDLWFQANDPGDGSFERAECKRNNLWRNPAARCAGLR